MVTERSQRTSPPSSDSDFSAPWTRASLLNTPTYVASKEFLPHVLWLKTGNLNELVTPCAPTDAKDSSPTRATCAVVGTISSQRLFLEPHGNYNPNFEKTALETSKAQFQIVSPTVHPEFQVDFSRGIEHIETLQRQAIKEGPDAEHFVVADGLKKALKFSWPLFEKRVSLYDPTDEEDWTNDYPIAQKFRDSFDDIVSRWRVTPLPAFDTRGRFIKAHELEVSLRGALVLVYFELRHYPIKNKRTNGVSGNTFSATATQVKILERATERQTSPYKSLLLKGPTLLPQSPSKKKEQADAVRAFHPAALTGDVHEANSENPDLNPKASTSKAEGKKRAINDDDDATATDDEGPTPGKSTKKKRAK